MRFRTDKHRKVLDCLATQAIPATPVCKGCSEQRLCDRIVAVLANDVKTYQTVARIARRI